MNKLKIIYNVVRKMKDKDSIKGSVKAEGLKDSVKVFGVDGTFEKSKKDGETKGRHSFEIDCGGNKMKFENSVNFQGEGCQGPHNFFKHIHGHHGHHHGQRFGGVKEGINRIAMVLGILSSVKIDEKEDGSVVLSLESANIPEEIRNSIHEHMKNGCEHHKQFAENHPKHEFVKEFHDMDNTAFTLNIFINKDSEISKVAIELTGKKKDENKDMRVAAELNLE